MPLPSVRGRLELREVGDAVGAAAGSEHIELRQRHQHRIAAGAATGDQQAVGIGLSRCHEMSGERPDIGKIEVRSDTGHMVPLAAMAAGSP